MAGRTVKARTFCSDTIGLLLAYSGLDGSHDANMTLALFGMVA